MGRAVPRASGRAGLVCHPGAGKDQVLNVPRSWAGSSGEAAAKQRQSSSEAAGLRAPAGPAHPVLPAPRAGRRGPAEQHLARGHGQQSCLGGSPLCEECGVARARVWPGCGQVLGWDGGRRAPAARCCGASGTASLVAEHSRRTVVACPVSGTGGDGAQGTACATLGSDGLVGARWGGGYQGGGRQWGRTSGDRQQHPSEVGTQCNGIVLLWAGCDPVP